VSSLVLKPALDSLSVGPKCQNHQLAAYGLKVCCKWSPPYVIFSPLKRRTMNSYLSTRIRGSQPSSLSLSKPLQCHQLTMALYLTGNHGFWYCTCGRLLSKSSMDHWTHENWKNMMKTHDPCPFQSQKDPRSSPTAQTREGTTPLMLLRL
jgi:hypothetical protein